VARVEHTSAADLLEAFGVDQADVDLNAQGRLGPGQQRRLRRMAVLNLVLALALGAGLGAIWLATVEHPVLWWQWVLVAALEAALVAVSLRWIGKLLTAARDGSVVRHSGPVNAFARRGKHLTVAGLTYNVPIPLNRLVQGASYDVYVVEPPAMVVAMVPTGPAT
jgi:hypothetical protein